MRMNTVENSLLQIERLLCTSHFLKFKLSWKRNSVNHAKKNRKISTNAEEILKIKNSILKIK